MHGCCIDIDIFVSQVFEFGAVAICNAQTGHQLLALVCVYVYANYVLHEQHCCDARFAELVVEGEVR